MYLINFSCGLLANIHDWYLFSY